MKTSNIIIVSAQEDFSFPLAEAARKQLWAEAKMLRDCGKRVEVLIVTPGRRDESVHDGIPLRQVLRRDIPLLAGYLSRFDLIHYWGTTGLVALAISVVAPFKKKIFTSTDGSVFSTGDNASRRRFLARFLFDFYDQFRVFTQYQMSVFLGVSRRYERKLALRAPLLEEKAAVQAEKNSNPTLLYMGHLSRFKGVDVVFQVFERLLPEFPDLELVIADNGLVYDDGCREEANRLVEKYRGHVVLKGKVEPHEEISRAHVLIHPLRQHRGTFAFPLSLYECLLCGTPFLTSRLEGVSEYFDESFLCEIDNSDKFVEKARQMLNNPEEMSGAIVRNLESIRKAAGVYEKVSAVS